MLRWCALPAGTCSRRTRRSPCGGRRRRRGDPSGRLSARAAGRRAGREPVEHARHGPPFPGHVDALHGRLERIGTRRRRVGNGRRATRVGPAQRCRSPRMPPGSSRRTIRKPKRHNVRRSLPGRLTIGALLAIAAVLIVLPVASSCWLVSHRAAARAARRLVRTDAAQLRRGVVRPDVSGAARTFARCSLRGHSRRARHRNGPSVARRSVRRTGPPHSGSLRGHAAVRFTVDRRVRVGDLGIAAERDPEHHGARDPFAGSINVYTFGGICFVFAIYYAPYVFLFSAASLRNMDRCSRKRPPCAARRVCVPFSTSPCR